MYSSSRRSRALLMAATRRCRARAARRNALAGECPRPRTPAGARYRHASERRSTAGNAEARTTSTCEAMPARVEGWTSLTHPAHGAREHRLGLHAYSRRAQQPRPRRRPQHDQAHSPRCRIDPAPERTKRTSWRAFLRAHWGAIARWISSPSKRLRLPVAELHGRWSSWIRSGQTAEDIGHKPVR
jgi:hypothetical protein